MSLYNVGDFVLLKTKCVMTEGWIPEMDSLLGNVVKIVSVSEEESIKYVIYTETTSYSYLIIEQQIETFLTKNIDVRISFSVKLTNILKKWNPIKFNIIKFKEHEEDFPFNYLDIAISDPTKISYITKDREKRFIENNVDYFDVIQREKFAYMSKPGKILQKLASKNVEITKEDIEKVQALLFEARGCKLEIVRGKDIRKYYHTNAYCGCTNIGSLGESCMRYSGCQKYFDFYVDNLAMIILRCPDCGKLIGRALLWENIEIENEKRKVIFMDRIYGNDQTLQLFKYHAFLNGWMHKKYQSYSDPILKEYLENKEEKEYYYKLVYKVRGQYTYFPFMDTMAYAHYTKKGELILRNYEKMCYSKNITQSDPECLRDTEGNTRQIQNLLPE